MSDKFSIDDILAEIGSDKDVSKETAKSAGTADKKAPSQSTPGATMILNSIDEKKKIQKVPHYAKCGTARLYSGSLFFQLYHCFTRYESE